MDMKTEEAVVEELLERLGDICEELGWSIAILGGDGDDSVDGMIIGTDSFVQAAIEMEGLSVTNGKKSNTTH